VKELWEKARTRGRAIIFVDECDGVAVPDFAGKTTSGFAGRNLSKVVASLYRLAAARRSGQR
jgi:ATP-dependent 26S proteasome regulatory subunit